MPKDNINKLLEVMASLRDPDTGCPWDLEQDFSSIAPYTIEEAYEVADAIDRGDLDELRDELGDLLLQVVFHSRMAQEQRAFDFNDVAGAIADKMLRRHPHVFGDEEVADAQAQMHAWEEHKRREREAEGDTRVLDGVSLGLPALLRAAKLGKRAAQVGFDWPEVDGVRDKVTEELAELEEAQAGEDQAAVAEEIGDLLFAVAQLARHLEVNPEEALRAANGKFVRRFEAIESGLRADRARWDEQSIDELERRWQAVKRDLRSND
ncbi:MAG: nucleoside triphosphate pyrophosphohydrolase [Gammaproteobacteria bacterium]